jgi:hypothetical protein
VIYCGVVWDRTRLISVVHSGSNPDSATNLMKKKFVIGKEYWVQMRNAELIRIEGNTAVCRDRWDYVFECDLACVQEKDKPKNKNPK